MNKVFRRRLEMAVRVRDFLRAHKMDGAGDAEALTRLEDVITRGQVLVKQQLAGVMVARSATAQRYEIRRLLETKLLSYLAAAGAIAARDDAALALEFRLPRKANHQSFLATARRMVEKATTLKDQLVKEGMAVSLLDDLAAALEMFERTLEASRTGRREHVGASAELDAVAAEIVERVRLLDGLVKYRLGDNPELMGAWTSARNVLGPFRSKPVVSDGQTPGEGPNAVKPAA